ncbi:MAG TPA: VWA domain-containing protein [Pyrinomonadaceae bacterium]|nr:VWA domain-containing protein [Pyrinomonadaceae bacterium]
MRSRRYSASTVALLIILTFVLSTTAGGQSGRRKNSSKPPAQKKTSPIADPKPITTVEAPAQSTKKSAGASSHKTSEEIEESDILRISSNLVPIPASVVDVKGYAVTTLGLRDFELRVDGQVRPISEMTRAETAVRLAMLFDNSGSLDFARQFETQAAKHFFRRVIRPIDEAAIYSVETESYLAQPLTNDIGRLEQTIESFGRPEGSTSLFDAIIDAAAYLRPYAGRRVLVIVSDGVETTSRADFEITLQRVLADDCQIFVVQTGLYDGANVRALAAERRMQEFAVQTGGAVYVPRSTTELETAFAQIAADLAEQYVLSYYPSESARDGRFHVIELRISSRKDVRVRTRKGYYSPKA